MFPSRLGGQLGPKFRKSHTLFPCLPKPRARSQWTSRTEGRGESGEWGPLPWGEGRAVRGKEGSLRTTSSPQVSLHPQPLPPTRLIRPTVHLGVLPLHPAPWGLPHSVLSPAPPATLRGITCFPVSTPSPKYSSSAPSSALWVGVRAAPGVSCWRLGPLGGSPGPQAGLQPHLVTYTQALYPQHRLPFP